MPHGHDTDDFDERRTLVAPRRSRAKTQPPPLPPPRKPARTARGTAPPEKPAKPAPQKLPSFVPAETVLPVVQYRGGDQPALAPAHGAAAALRAYAAGRSEAPPLVRDPIDLTRAVAAPGHALPAPRAALPPPVRPPPPRASEPVAIPRPALGRRGQVIVVFGCRGGAGATMLSVNTAAELARCGRTVCLVDVDLELGDVFVALDLAPQASLARVAADAAQLDPAALRRRLAHHRSGLYATTQVGEPDEVGASAMARRIPELLHGLAAHFDDVVVDGVRDFDDIAVASLAAADQILLVLTQDVLSVRRAARAITRLRRLGHGAERVRLVVNRARGGAEIDDDAIQRALGLRVASVVRDDPRVTTALDDGALLSDLPRARGVAADVSELAGLVAAGAGPRTIATPRRPRGLLGRLLGGS